MKTSVTIGLTFLSLTSVLGKVVYRHVQTPDSASFISASNNGISSKQEHLSNNGLINGVDIDLNTLTNINSHDLFNAQMPPSASLMNNHLLSGIESHHGLAVDWPNRGTFNENYHTLSNYFQISPQSQFLVHLDAVPDFVLSPQESLFASSMSDPHLLEMKTSVLKQPKSIVADISHKDDMLSTVDDHIGSLSNDDNPTHYFHQSAYEPFAHEFKVASSDSIVSLPDTSTVIPDIKDQVVMNNEKSLSISTGDTVNVDSSIAQPFQSQSSIADKLGLPIHIFKTLPPLFIELKKPGNNHQQHKLVKRSGNSTPTPTLKPLVKHLNTAKNPESSINDGTRNIAKNVQIREALRHNLPPLTDIFGGMSLFKPKAKIVTFFNLSPKQEALRRFAG